MNRHEWSLIRVSILIPTVEKETDMAVLTKPRSSASGAAGSTGGKNGKGGKGGKDGGGTDTLKPTDIIPVWMDVATARNLLLALSLALGGSGDGKKKKSGMTGGG